MFIVRRIAFMLAIPLALFLGGSAVAESFAEGQLANGMRSTLGLSEKPEVQIEAFPILYRVVQGRIPRVIVSARTFTLEGFEIAELRLDVEGVEASLAALLRQNRFDLSVQDGSGFARATEGSINAYLEREKIDAVVTLREDGTVSVAADEVVAGKRRRFVAAGELTLGGRVLSFKPTTVTMDGEPVPQAFRARARRETTFSVELPKLPAGIVPSEIVVTKGELKLVADLEGFVLKVR